MRVTGGCLKGRMFKAAEGLEARYTSSKVREALFNILGSIDGREFLDLFAGSGSITIEALSRGAASATSVEKNRTRADIIRQNLRSLDLNKYCQVLDMDVRYAIPLLGDKGAAFDIIFMDPPYEKGYPTETMMLLEKHRIYKNDAVIVMEYSSRETISFPDIRGFNVVKTKKYGGTVLAVFAVDEMERRVS